jgi:hypothetical protein
MRMVLTMVVLLMLTVHLFPSGIQAESEAAREAVKKTALDYMDGLYAGDAARVERAVHPELTKVSVIRMPGSDKDILKTSGYTMLIELVRANVGPVPENERNIDVTIYSILDGIASVKIASSRYEDYVALAEIDGAWKLINVLGQMNPEWLKQKKPEILKQNTPFDPAKEKTAIETAALDYIEGYFEGDAQRMARAIHPELTKLRPLVLPQTGRTAFDKMGAGMLVGIAGSKSGLLEKDKRGISVKIYDFNKDLASVEVICSLFYDYLQMAKIDGEWKIVNVLWRMNPAAETSKR